MGHSKLTDKEKKQILAHYVETQNYSETARLTGVSRATVQRVVKNMPNVSEKVHQKNEQNTKDVLGYMQTQKETVCKLITTYLAAMLDPEKIKKANVVQLATALGILIDKCTTQDEKPADTSLMEALLNAVKGGGNGDTV